MVRVLVVACTHGTEKVGLRVQESLERILGPNPNIDFTIGNPDALKDGVRFKETDLNRSFPGRIDGSKEERLAFDLAPVIRSYDVVIDIHSTVSGLESAVILADLNEKSLALARATQTKYVLYMRITEGQNLISGHPAAIGFEYGADDSEKTHKDTVEGICMILKEHGFPVDVKVEPTQGKIFLDVYEAIPKPSGFVAENNIENFKLVQSGQVYARNPVTGEELRAEADFYPVLFGQYTYEDKFGFKGRRDLVWEAKL